MLWIFWSVVAEATADWYWQQEYERIVKMGERN
jgi:hypothetical protein